MSATDDKGSTVNARRSDGLRITKNDKALLCRTSLAWLGAITVGFFFYTLTYLTDPPYPFSENPEDQSQRCCEQGEPLNATSAGEDNKAGNPKETRQQKNKELEEIRKTDLAAQRGMWRATNVVAVIAFIQAVATIASIFLLFVTWKTTQKAIGLGQRTLNLTRTSLDHTASAAHAAAKTAEAAENAERAYVVVEPVCKLNSADKSKFRVCFQLKNYGKTPATRVSSQFRVKADASSRNPYFNTAFPPCGIVATNQPQTIKLSEVEGRIADYLDITEESKRKYFEGFGRCNFNDIFGRRHTSYEISYQIEFLFTEASQGAWQDADSPDPALDIASLAYGLTDSEIDVVIAENIKAVRVNLGYPLDESEKARPTKKSDK